MKTAYYCIALIIMLAIQVRGDAFNLNLTDKHGDKMSSAKCNPNTVIDFRLSSSSTITCTSSGCTIQNPTDSVVRFLDVSGSEETYYLAQNLTEIYQTSSGTRTYETGLIKLGFLSVSLKQLYVGVPFTNSTPSSTQLDMIDLSKVSDSAFNTIQTTINITNMPLSSLNILNRRQYSMFYHIADSSTAPTETYLLSYFVFGNIKFGYTNLPTASYNFPDSSIFTTANPAETVYKATGDMLCWGSSTEGLFQTHLRESYPLWTAMIGLFFYWIYILVAEANEMGCYDKKFEDNKWTSWGIFSLNRLGHQDYFTKLSRTSNMLITFSWYGCVLAILYAQVPPGKGSVMILWAAIIALFTGMPFTYSMGYIFLRKIYQLTLQKYITLKKMKDVFNKKDPIMDTYEKEIDDIEQTLYGYYYWYYVLTFAFFTAFWTIAVHEMIQVPREYYYFMYYFLASVGVTLGLEHLLIDPIMTYFFGNWSFYRNRGFYYDFRLGAAFKEIEE